VRSKFSGDILKLVKNVAINKRGELKTPPLNVLRQLEKCGNPRAWAVVENI